MRCTKCRKGTFLQKQSSSKKGRPKSTSLECNKCGHQLVSLDQVEQLAQQKTRELQNQATVKISKMSHSIGIRIPKHIADRAGFKIGQMALIKKAKQGINVVPQK